MKYICLGKVNNIVNIAPNIFDMIISAPKIVKEAKPGQFVNLYSSRGETILPRPISIAYINLEDETIRLIYAVVGKGTSEFSNLNKGDTIKMVGPLGQGFQIDKNITESIIVAGGVGTPPMLELCKNLSGNIKAYLGFRSNPILVKEFEDMGVKVHIATDDGSIGFKGNNIALLRQENPSAQMMYGCGPKIMLKAASKWAEEKQIPFQVSIEERMGCGLGACAGCVCKTKIGNGDDWENTKVCMNGPVFWSNEVIWDD